MFKNPNNIIHSSNTLNLKHIVHSAHSQQRPEVFCDFEQIGITCALLCVLRCNIIAMHKHIICMQYQVEVVRR